MLKSKIYRYKEEKIKGKFTQTFEYEEHEYALNKDKTDVVVIGSYDLRDKLNSYKDTCLHVMLEKFLGNNIEIPNLKKRKLSFDDYDDLNSYVDSLRVKYNLSFDKYPTFDSVFNYIETLKDSNATKINQSQDLLIKKSQSANKEDLNNGKNEKEIK